MSNVATLTLKGTSDLKAISTDLKGVATSAQQAKTPLDGLGKSMDTANKSTASFGQKLKGFGSQFSSSIASIGTLGGTVLNLSRQYQDLGDSQIAVEKAQRRVSTAQEAVTKATTALSTATSKYGQGSAQAVQATLDLEQAQAQLSINTQLLTERQEDHQRAQENFWVGLIPTVTSAGASVMSVVTELGGTKGLSGLVGKFKGVGEAAKGLGISMKTALIGTGIGALLVTLGIALEAFANNWWGVRDAVNDMGIALGNAVPGLKPALEALGKVGEAIVGTFGGPNGAVPKAMHESSLAIALFGDTTTASLDKALKYTDFMKRMTAAQAQFDLEAKFGSKEKLKAASIALEKLIEEGEKLIGQETQQQAFARNSIKLYADKTGAIVENTTATNSLSTATDGLGTSTAALNTPLVNVSGSFATITSNVGPASTALGGLNEKMNPFNANLVVAAQKVAEENSELALLTKSSIAGAKVFQNMAQRQQDLARVLNQTTQSMKKQTQSALQLANAINTSGGYAVKGTQVGSGSGSYKTFRNGVQIGQGSGNAPPRKLPGVGTRVAASGMHETINQPTWILAGEAGKERVDIDTPGRGGGGGTTIVNVYLDGDRIDQGIRYRINRNQGAIK